MCRRVIYWGRSGPAVPVCGAYAIRPYTSDRLFSSEWVGAYCIRPIGRPRQGDECGCPVISLGDLWESSGLYRARLWGVCNTPLRLRFSFFVRQGRGVLHTPHQASPERGRWRVWGLECHVRFWDCGGGGGGVTGSYLGLRRGRGCQYGRYFELPRGGD